jgi:hypothetical protein
MVAHESEHVEDCKRLIGRGWARVHSFLDQYANVFPPPIFNEYHRTFLHNRRGLELIKARWGEEAELAGIIHLVRDSLGTPIDNRSLEWVKGQLGKALMYFNSMELMDPGLHPSIVAAWDSSLCNIAFNRNGKDKHFRDIREY